MPRGVPVPLNPNPVKPDDKKVGAPGGTFYASAGGGWQAASGVVSASSYQLEETQELAIQFKRVPRGSVNSYYGAELNLSSASATYVIDETYLIAKITASYSRKKTYTNTGPPFLQNQRFGWEGVSAVDGVSYGTLTASTLGPAGNIYTLQPFYYRRAWDDNVDTEVNRYVECTDYYVSGYTWTQQQMSVPNQRGATWKKYERYFIPASQKFSFLDQFDHHAGHDSGGAYDLVGPYSVTQESITGILSYINNRSHKLRQATYISIPPEVGDADNDGTPDILHNQGIPEYDPNRHDYTGY